MPVQIGGVLYGLYWYVELQIEEGDLPIAAAELLAAVANVITFWKLLERARRVLMETDALTADFVLRKMHAHAQSMKAVLAAAVEAPAFKRLMLRPAALRGKHNYGEGNPLADRASRGELRLLTRMYQAMGMKAQRVELNEQACS